MIMQRHDSQRGWFAYELYQTMSSNPDVYLIVGDLGYKMFDTIKDDFPDRFINTGAAEQSMMGVAVGLALEGKIPVVYSITPFLLYRCFETIRNYINHESIPVIMAGGGRDKDYEHDGFSHWSEEDKQVMDLFPNIYSCWPEEKEEIPDILRTAIKSTTPTYINLRR